MSPKFGGKWGMECFNTRLPLPTLLCAGYSVKLIKLLFLPLEVIANMHTGVKEVINNIHGGAQSVKYLIFSFLRFGVEVKRSVEFRHSNRNASRSQQKMLNRVS